MSKLANNVVSRSPDRCGLRTWPARIARPSVRALQIAAIVLAECAIGTTPTFADVDFATEVQPILQQHCTSCHGADRAAGGLRLDNRPDALLGGDTQLPVLGGSLETNELYRRVSSQDETYRMPKGADALSAREVDQIKEWVEAGTPWPESTLEPPEETQSWLDYAAGLVDRLKARLPDVPFFRQFLVAFLVMNVVILVLERRKKGLRQAASDGWGSGIGWPHYVILWGCWGGTMFAVYSLTQLSAARDQVDKLERELTHYAGKDSITALFGNPPIPFRPEHPAALSHTYYRGNCERSSRLFNNGNYRTAEMTVSLRDSLSEDLIEADSNVTGRELMIRFELLRSRATSEALFSKALMRSVFLSPDYYSKSSDLLKSEPIHLTAVREDWHWKADFPIGVVDSSFKPDGLVYVYKGRVVDGRMKGTPHYAISWRLRITDGIVDPSSDVWMGNLFLSPAVAPPPRPVPSGKVPFDEWFSHEPIPEITGENSTDPVLLGIPEHVGQGADSVVSEEDESVPDAE